jgi:uncharacterized protein (DUF1810 family)
MPMAHMDFIFPRLAVADGPADVGRYMIRSLDEARAYLDFPVIGNRYRECIGALQRLADRRADAVFGTIGAQQLHASLTLFSEASDEFLLETILDVWFDSLMDEKTVAVFGNPTEAT